MPWSRTFELVLEMQDGNDRVKRHRVDHIADGWMLVEIYPEGSFKVSIPVRRLTRYCGIMLVANFDQFSE